jgi:hypothetical protein
MVEFDNLQEVLMRVGDLLHVVGLALLVAFAGTFGFRWAILLAALSCLLVGFAFTTVVQFPTRARKPAPSEDDLTADEFFAMVGQS